MSGKMHSKKIAHGAVWILPPLVFFGIGYAMHQAQPSPLPTIKKAVESGRVSKSEELTVVPESHPRPFFVRLGRVDPAIGLKFLKEAEVEKGYRMGQKDRYSHNGQAQVHRQH